MAAKTQRGAEASGPASDRDASYAVTLGLILYTVVVGGVIALINID